MEDFPLHIQAIIKSLPEDPGVYQYYDSEGKILYVGKAKNLKKRVNSYFTKEHDNQRLRLLVKKIHEIKTIIVNSEIDALLLENNLIKTLQPRYNINLKDDKTYPWVVIKNEPFPRVFYTRKKIMDGSEYFGPFPNVNSLRALLELIPQLYKLRTCSLDLSKKKIEIANYRPCLEFHIGRCKAPCVSKQDENEYRSFISQIRQLLKGNLHTLIRSLKDEMMKLAEAYDYEAAQEIKLRIDLLEKYEGKSLIVNPLITDAEVYGFYDTQNTAFVSFFKVKYGTIVQGQTIELQKRLDESKEELLTFAINEIRQRYESNSKEIILPFEIDFQFPGIEMNVPKIGDKKKLVELSQKNARTLAIEKEKQQAIIDPESTVNELMQQMMKDLRMMEEPRRIECFDNSNIQGAFPVSAMTVFIDGKPAKKEYRHFNVKTVVGPDDFATMEEVIFRRYSRVIEEKLELPQLIVIDGGKGQLGAAINSLNKLQLMGKLTIVGIAKRLEEIYFPGDPYPLYIDKRSKTLRVLQHIRDEAHRFGITHHRSKRSRSIIKTELSEINGIGESTAQKLLNEFKSVKEISNASFDQLKKVVGNSKAEIIIQFFKSKNNS
jgi:excinuclease ABC subunit C